jgi:hypothetical protein
VDELIDSGSGLEQRLDHQGVFALDAVGGLNETLHFASTQAICRSIPDGYRFQSQTAPDPFHDVFGLMAKVRIRVGGRRIRERGGFIGCAGWRRSG